MVDTEQPLFIIAMNGEVFLLRMYKILNMKGDD